ncbi:MAG: protein translocase subunit SecF [Gammaproteobacteria bacterium]
MTFQFDFLRWRYYFWGISAVFIGIGIISLAVNGLKYGLDFTGGLSMELDFSQPVKLADLRQVLEEEGFESVQVSHFGADHLVLVRLPPAPSYLDQNEQSITSGILAALERKNLKAQVLQFESIGPRIGDELREKGGIAVLVALFGILLYITFRFQQKFALAAVLALFHDVVFVLGIFALLGLNFDLTVLAAILALIGYSLNDTIVVCDRIRSNMLKLRGRDTYNVLNISLNQTLARTLVTSLTTLLVLLCLRFLGGAALQGFSTTLIVGVVVGTYSSIYIASTALLLLRLTSADLMPKERDPEEEVNQ